MSDLRQRLTDALRDTIARYPAPLGYYELIVDALLSLPGIAIVELPEPEEHTEMDEPEQRCWYFPHDISGWNGEFPGVMDCDADMSPSIARSIAASLLAAANAAELVTPPGDDNRTGDV